MTEHSSAEKVSNEMKMLKLELLGIWNPKALHDPSLPMANLKRAYEVIASLEGELAGAKHDRDEYRGIAQALEQLRDGLMESCNLMQQEINNLRASHEAKDDGLIREFCSECGSNRDDCEKSAIDTLDRCCTMCTHGKRKSLETGGNP